MFRSHTLLAAAVVSALALSTAACSRSAGEVPATQATGAQAAGPIKFGLLNSMTGAYGAVGKQEKAAIDLAVKEINDAGGVNGRKFEVVVVDDQGSISDATAGFKRLAVEDKLPVVLGPGITATSQAVAPLADQYKVTLINFAQQPEIVEGKKYAFQLLGPQRSVAEAMVDYAAGKGITKAGLLHINDPFGTNGSNYIAEAAKAKGISIDFADSWNADGFDFSSQISKVTKSNPPLMFLYGSGGTSNGQVLKQLRASGYQGIVLGDITFASGQLSEVAGDAGDTIISFSQINYADPSTKTSDFLSGMQAALGQPAASFAATGYDSVYLLKAAIEKAGGDYTADKITAALESPDLKFTGVLGTQEYSADHHAGPGAGVFVPVQLDKGKFITPSS